MKPSRLAFAALLAILVFAVPGKSCGPFFPEAIFISNVRPDGPYARYAAGHLGVPQPGYRVQDLVVAYDWLNGHGLSPMEQQQAVALDRIRRAADSDDDSASAPPGIAAWLQVRKNAGIPLPPSGAQADLSAAGIETDRPVPGAFFEFFTNCLDPAFANAAATFTARRAAHPEDTAALTDWVHGEDAVFANCNGSSNTMPASAPAGAPAWLLADRAYQQAAAAFYQTNFDEAITRFKAIAAESASPWRDTARFVIARALLRRATLGQITEVPAEAAGNNASFTAQENYRKHLRQQEPERLAEARTALQAIVADPAMQSFHQDAEGLLDFIALRLDPAAQETILEARLTAPNREQTPGSFQQALIDLRYLLYPAEDGPATETLPYADSPLVTWMNVMRAAPVMQQAFVWGMQPDPGPLARPEAQALAVDRWQQSHADTWLIAALATADANSSHAALVEAAAKLPENSPGWTAATYNRLRLIPEAATLRSALAATAPLVQQSTQRSTHNLFNLLRQRSAPTLAAFLGEAANLPAGIVMDTDWLDAPSTKPDPEGLCGVHGSPATTLLFNPSAAVILNTRMPLSVLANAAADTTLPPNLIFQLAQATWTRAVLLNRSEVAARMTPLLTGCYPAWKPWLTAYDTAATPVDRQAAALLALMRFASTEPLVRAGSQRATGFAIYSVYRDNWWSPSTTAKPETKTAPAIQDTLFGTLLVPLAALPNPPFLTAEDESTAATEIAALRKIPCSSDYFANAALDWQKQHSQDPRTPEILGFAERAVRNGCRTDATAALNHRLFDVVQTRYPKSEWARRYTTWE